MKNFVIILIGLFIISFSFGQRGEKPRVIVTTDISGTAEPDDYESMIRLMVYSNMIDIEGLITNTSAWRQSGEKILMHCIKDIIDKYGEVRSNLLLHASGYPTVSYLKSVCAVGQQGFGTSDVGSGKSTAGSNHIISVILDDPDPRPVWVLMWGGANTLAQAFYDVEHSRPGELNKFINKIRCYDIQGQDDAGAWINHKYSGVFYLRAAESYFGMSAKTSTNLHGAYTSDEWFEKNVMNYHGPLGDVYPFRKGKFEGDTPSFLPFLCPGLNGAEWDDYKQHYGDWGGKFYIDIIKNKSARYNAASIHNEASKWKDWYMYGDAKEDGSYTVPVERWRPGFQNDFAARMDWCVKSYTNANHRPVAVVNGDETYDIITVKGAPGSQVTLDATGSSDPDFDNLSYNWWHHNDVEGSYTSSVTISNSTSKVATVTVPSSIGSKSAHIILEVKDNGSPQLVDYRRILIEEGAVELTANFQANQTTVCQGGTVTFTDFTH